MAKRQIDYDLFIKEYELGGITESQKESMKRQIRRKLSEVHGEKSWEELSQIEKNFFLYLDMQNYLLELLPKGAIRDRIANKIKRKLQPIKVEQIMRDHNDAVSLTPYFVEGDSEVKKKEAFERYKLDYYSYNKKDPDETYEEWSQSPSIRPYDLYQQAVLKSFEEAEQENNIDYPVRDDAFTTSEITRYTINIICDVLQKKLGITIDTESLKDCVTFVHEYELGHDSSTSLQLEYDPDSSVGKIEQEKTINADRKYATCRYRLDHLDFWKDENSDSKSNKKSDSKH